MRMRRSGNVVRVWACVLALLPGVALADAVLVRAGNGIEVTASDVLADAERIPSEIRQQILKDPGKVAQLASNIAITRALAAQAEQAGLANDPQVVFNLKQARDKVLVDALLLRAETSTEVNMTAVERLALSDYKANPDRFMLPEQVQASHILFRGDDARERAAKALIELRKPGADFGKLASELSQDPGSAQRNGDLGFFARGRMAKAFEDAAFALQTDEISDVVETEFGAHIIKVTARRPASRKPFEEVKEQLSAEIVKRLKDEARAAAVAPVRASVVPDLSSLEAFSAAQ